MLQTPRILVLSLSGRSRRLTGCGKRTSAYSGRRSDCRENWKPRCVLANAKLPLTRGAIPKPIRSVRDAKPAAATAGRRVVLFRREWMNKSPHLCRSAARTVAAMWKRKAAKLSIRKMSSRQG